MTFQSYIPYGNPDFSPQLGATANQIDSIAGGLSPSTSATYGPYQMQGAAGVQLSMDIFSGAGWGITLQWSGGSGSAYATQYESLGGSGAGWMTQNLPIIAPYLTIVVANTDASVSLSFQLNINYSTKSSRGAAALGSDGVGFNAIATSYPVGTTYTPAYNWSPGYYQFTYHARAAFTGIVYLIGRQGTTTQTVYAFMGNLAAQAYGFAYILCGNYQPWLQVTNSGSSAVSLDFSLTAVPL